MDWASKFETSLSSKVYLKEDLSLSSGVSENKDLDGELSLAGS